MIKWTKEEISLCKQVTEKYRKEIEYGDWYWSKSHNKPLIAIAGGFKANDQKHFGVFKLWTISDCLEFLRERDYTITFHDLRVIYPELEQPISVVIYRLGQKVVKTYYGETPLEACLKAVLAVLEEEK